MSILNQIEGLTINESDYRTQHASGRIAVLMYVGNSDPKAVLDYAVSLYVQGKSYHELIDANLDNPWMRVIVSDINDMIQEKFEVGHHTIGRPLNR
jgi:hypothetical protein